MAANKKAKEDVNRIHELVAEFVAMDWQKYKTEKTIDLTK